MKRFRAAIGLTAGLAALAAIPYALRLKSRALGYITK